MFETILFRARRKAEKTEPAEARPEENNAPTLAEELSAAFAGCADFTRREIRPGGTGESVTVCWIEGLVSSEEVAETVLRPLALLDADDRSGTPLPDRLEQGAVYSAAVRRRQTAAAVAEDLTAGATAVLFRDCALTFDTRSREHRSIAEPMLERSILGAKDSFTEVYRLNTALVRRRLAVPALKLREQNVGRLSRTRVGILYLEGVARPEVAAAAEERLTAIDIDGVTGLGDIAEALAPRPRGEFPQLIYTERPDRFARALLQGRVGLLIDGLPQGLLLPCTLPEMLRVAEDRSLHAAAASALLLLRWAALLLSLLLPAVYVAVASFHQEMIPYPLLQSIIESKQGVPFSTPAEILGMLGAFGLLQEAGLRLPEQAGTTVSIIGTLIVGQSAVEARVVSPIAVIVVALSGIAGYTQPNQQLGAALRLWRTLLVLGALAMGLYGLMAAAVVLLWRLCAMECCGVSYLYPLADGERHRLAGTFLRPPLRLDLLRDAPLSRNRRRRA